MMTNNGHVIIEIPEIVASRLLVNPDEENVILEFLDMLDEENETGRVVSKITIKKEAYFDFVLSFLQIGVKAQKEMGVDLGINISEEEK